MDEEYIGVIKLFAGNFAPEGYMFCNGQELQVSQYQALYSIIGTNFGGTPPNTFKLPDLRGRVPLGAGAAVTGTNYPLAQNGGQEAVTLTVAQMPAHNHSATTQPFSADALGISATVNAGTAGTTTNDPTGAYWGKSPASGAVQSQDYTDSKNVTMATDAVQVQLSGSVPATGVNVSVSGNSAAHENRQPFLALNYIICVNGLYPPRP
ncbi:microcystin-dependent protein [Rheinheimera pacifica]|uniref:phage tail protein n=1 Tax=Rheinheimera pacifica TaxID=173990 RepID=UPI002865DFD0|nr:tail fiber protein [Rheinheimera pacifica]MDR6982155.1 microcystin-dependent protein [Rheinheimera pacifica]